MSDLSKIVKVTKTQYDTLASGGTVGTHTGLDSSYLYMVQDNDAYLPYTSSVSLSNVQKGVVCNNIGYAASNISGVVSSGQQTFGGTKTFLDPLTCKAFLRILNDDSDSYESGNFESGADIDTTYYAQGIHIDDAYDSGYYLNFPNCLVLDSEASYTIPVSVTVNSSIYSADASGIINLGSIGGGGTTVMFVDWS